MRYYKTLWLSEFELLTMEAFTLKISTCGKLRAEVIVSIVVEMRIQLQTYHLALFIEAQLPDATSGTGIHRHADFIH